MFLLDIFREPNINLKKTKVENKKGKKILYEIYNIKNKNIINIIGI